MNHEQDVAAVPSGQGPRVTGHGSGTRRGRRPVPGPRSPVPGFLLCGIPGTALDDGERLLLAELRPGGIILFARNVESREQLVELVYELRAMPWRPYVAADVEGGRVNRLQRIIGPLPSPAAAASAGIEAVAALGEAIGAACAHLGIGVDFAPVLDISQGGGWVGGEDRCLGCDVDRVAELGEVFLAALEGFGVAGCLKHYPGLGSGAVDSHRDLPLLGDGVVEEERAFAALVRPGRAVMVAHAIAPALGEGVLPASLSATVVERLRRFRSGPVIADDLEMGALASFGGLPERAAAALLAGCDQVPVCNAMAARADVLAAVMGAGGRDPVVASRLRRSAARTAGYGLGPLRGVSWDEVERLAERARRAAGGGV